MWFETRAGHCTGTEHLTYDNSMRYDGDERRPVVAIDNIVARVARDTVFVSSSRSSLWSVAAVALRNNIKSS